MTVTDHPLRSNKKRVDASAWQGLLAEATLPRDPSLAVNPFKPPSLHPPSVHGADAMAQDEAFSEAGSWAFSALESAIRGGFYTMAFLGFPALANLSQKAEYRRMVEIISTEMTRKWIKITVSSETDKGDAVKKIEQAMHQFRVRELFRKAAEHDGFFGRGHIFIDTGAPDDIELATSIGAGGDDVSRAKVGVNRLRSLRVIEPVWCSPAEYNATNPLDANFYVPTAWYVQNKRIHASRLLTFVSRPVSDLLKPAYAFGGIPLIQLAQEYVENWDRVRGSIGRLVESFSIIGLKTKLAEALNNGMSSDDMIRRLRLFTEFRKNQGTFIIDADEDFFNVNIPLGGLDELQAQAQEHMCLRKGTFIETDRGQVPIEKVTVSDKVMTRNGYAPVVWSGITKYVSRLVEIETKASSLFMTEEHPVWSETAGAFVSARTVDPSDRLRRSLAWDATANQSLGVVGSGVGRKLAISGIRKLAGSCTASFMRFMSDLSRRASTFITSMATDLITSFPTFASCLVANTMPNTSHEGSIRALGTSSARNARSAASPTLPLGPTGLDSVGLPASRGNGKDASVVAARAFDCEPEPVYDITVADGHLPEFYANGILVHNSTVAGIPLVKFFGLSPHGLNATSEPEIRVFYDWIASLQESFFRGPLTSILNFLQLNIAGEIDPDIGFTFEPLWTASEAEQAQVRSTNAQTDRSYIDGNVLSPLEVRKKVANDKEMPYSGLELDDTPELSDAQLSENATKMATPTLQAFSDGLIDASQALAELVEAGLFKTITPEDVANAKAQQEVPEPPGPGDPSAEGGGGGGAPPPNGPPQSPRPSGGPPNLRLASASDESKRFDLGHLTKIESERLRQALRTGDLETVREILAEREAYRGAWDDVGSFVAYHGTPFDFDHFDESHIGTGTARAHYGRGIYLASKPEVARRYLNELTDRLQLSGKPIHRLNAAETHITGHLYTVRVMRPRTAFFPWEMLGLPDKSGLSDELQHRLEREGYEGIVYRDPILRGELNYVVFDPKNIEVLKQDDRLIAQDDGPKGEPRNDHGEWTEGGGSHVTMRESGQNIGSEEVKKLTRPGHFYRGMEPAEFHATVGRGAGVKSRGDYSTRNEGTVFSHEADTAESYANYGSSDPRKTGRTNYLVEIRDHGDMKQDRDGYFKTQTEVPAANITRVWSMEPQGGAIIGKPLVQRRQDDRLIAADRDVSEEKRDHGKWTAGAAVGADPKVAQSPAPHRPHVEFQPVDPRERPPAQLSWESAPGKTTRNMPQFHDAPLEQRREYQKAVEKVLSDEKGHDVIAQTLGLRTGPTFSAAGVFQGRVNPGAQSQVNLGRLTDEDKSKINASEAIRGILLRQDAGAWHRPEPPPGHAYLIPGLKTAKGAVFPQDTGRGLTHKDALQALTPEEQKAFLASGSQNDANYVFKNDKGQILSRVAARQYAEENGLLSDIGKGYKQPKLISEHLDPHASTRFVDIDPQEANMLDFRMGRTPSEEEAGAVDKALSSVSGLDYALVPTQQGWRVLNTGSMPNDEFGAAVHQAIEGLESDTLPNQIDAQRAHYVGDYLANDWSKSPHAEDYLQAIGQAGPDVQRSADTILAQLGPKIAGVEDDFSKRYGWTPDASTRIWNKGPAQDLLARNGGAPHEGQVQDAADKILAKHGIADVIKSVRDKIAAGVPTNAHVKDGGHTLDDGSYTPERRQLHKDIVNKLFTPEAVQAASPAPGTRPTMTILGGRGGSGKSWITGDDGPVSRKNTVVIDSDHFKQQLPEYRGWNAGLLHEESSYIADRAAEIAKQRGLNVAFDQTMKSGSSAPKRLDQFADTHDLQGYYMHATPEVAADRAMGRFAKGGTSGDKTGRFVPPEYILGSHNNEANFDAIVPRLKKWGLYDNNGEKGAPKKVAEGKNDPNH